VIDARRIAEEERLRREAEENRRLQEQDEQLQMQMEAAAHPVPLDEAVLRKQWERQFKKDIAGFGRTRVDIESYRGRSVIKHGEAGKDLRKKIKSLEEYTDSILEYLLDGTDAPTPPELDWNTQSADRFSLLSDLARSVEQRLKTAYLAPRTVATATVDVNSAVALINDLQTLKILIHLLRY
jgi:hypothetical protein